MSLDDYKLSAELLGHSLDVRAIAVSDQYIVSGSRDKTAKIWEYNGILYNERLTLTNHTNFVSSVCVLNDGDWICTGSNDATICVYVAGNHEPFIVLKGHTATVSALAQGTEKGLLLSGSWDKTAIVWRINGSSEPISMKLEGHEAAVWSVCSLKSGEKFVTGSADRSIIYWNKKGEKLKVLKGHNDCVRALLSLSNDSIISASNDAIIKIWNEDGECIKELQGHTNYIYTIAFHLSENVFVSGGEDSTLRMWSADGELGNAMMLPAQSVWAVACLKNGDIVTGTSDGVVRIFTKDPNRYADEKTLASYTVAVEARARDVKLSLGGVKVNELPGEESLRQKGRPGQTKMVRKSDGNIVCYEWTGTTWEAVGDVVGATGGSQATSGKKLFEGKEYDFVFSVDISDSMPPLKLPYNRGDDPWLIAQSFIHKHELPQAYLDQVANFIITNAGNSQVVEPTSSSTYQDPFTGGGRYIPGSGSIHNSDAGNVDPFTGTSSYSTQSASVPVNFIPRSGQNMDPFTGSSSHTTSTSGGSAGKHFPFENYISITSCDPSKVLTKLREFNAVVEESLKVDDTELEEVIKLVSNNSTSTESIQALKKLLSWPKENLFPVLDVLRISVCNAEVCSNLITPEIMNLIIQNASVPPANQLMSIRVLSNMLTHEFGQNLIDTCLTNVMVAVSATKKGSANLQIAIATLLLNLSIVQKKNNATEDHTRGTIETIIDFLLWNADPEALYRSYRAIGNLLSTSHGTILSALLVSTDVIMEGLRNNMTVQQQYGFEKINEISREIINSI